MTDLDKAYDPAIEDEMYSWWEKNDLFKPETQITRGRADSSGPRFSITLPPPNVALLG